tara:strand:+ start:20190 stop:21458 length:1269 start_codon:yes stop_codon:yes gene_type:complete
LRKNLQEWLEWQESISPQEIDLNLERVRRVYNRLNFNRPRIVITVGGTNGKGSVVAMIESLLVTQGFSVASYTSPHMQKYNERIKFDGKCVDDETIIDGFEEIERIREGELLTYFEFGTLAALWIFSNLNLDVLILEVGLGGRLDAVNIVNSDGCIITNIGMDHADWLGDNIEEIAKEKAGIMRKNKPIVFGGEQLPKAIIKHAIDTEAVLIKRDKDFNFIQLSDKKWSWFGLTNERLEILNPRMRGLHQIENASAALSLFEAIPELTLPEESIINKSFDSINIEGRIDLKVTSNKNWLFDVAHNVDSISRLIDFISEYEYKKCIVVLGVLADKDIDKIIKLLTSISDQWIIPDLSANRSIDTNKLKLLITQKSHKSCSISKSVEEAMEEADIYSKAGDLIVVTGSFYTVSPALNWFNQLQS